jgi:hypothetical protein
VLFWRNEDDDEGEIGGGDDTSLDVPKFDDSTLFSNSDVAPDWDNDRVDGMRDLVDLLPVFLNIGEVLQSCSPDVCEYRLRQVEEDGHDAQAVNFFYGYDIAPRSEYRYTPGDVLKDPHAADNFLLNDENADDQVLQDGTQVWNRGHPEILSPLAR